MQLKSHITLSQKHQREFNVFPSFFTCGLNEFYFLKDEFGFRKPELSTWKNEANLTFQSRTFKVTIEYEAPNWVEISLRKINAPGKIYLSQLLEALNISFEKDFLGIQKTDHALELERQLMSNFQKARSIIQENWDEISVFINNADSLLDQ